ncbi:hypothetical protein E2C01_084042 [Portunus trituberculatus]|uniref:Uncharacterized protein n=1 Tax=Portunus trituberculatus TaxID=210409 RepID=A0A5B7J373_PORTR|nr:hypothetical protein [Portunus trituberculatus]
MRAGQLWIGLEWLKTEKDGVPWSPTSRDRHLGKSTQESLNAVKETHCCWNTAPPSQAKPQHNTSLLQHLQPSAAPRVQDNTWSHEELLG